MVARRTLRHGGRLRLAGIGAAMAVAAGLLAASALAVGNGLPDGTNHPYVGMAVSFPTGDPSGGAELCSGSLVSATVMVTAAHCLTSPNGLVLVSMNEHALADVGALFGGGPNTVLFGYGIPDPHWVQGTTGLSTSDRNDIGVVLLSSPQPGPYAQLPTLGYNDGLSNNQGVDIVGYGSQVGQMGKNPPAGYGSRLYAPAKIIPGGGATGSEFLKLSSSPGQGGATCFGDSGGPDLQTGTDLMLAISSYGPSATCKAVSYSQRMDTPEALGFVQHFLN